MRLTQGTFSYLPDLTDQEITAQVQYALDNGWAVSVEYTDDPHPRNTYWAMWDLPMFDLSNADEVVAHALACRRANPRHYVRINAYDSRLGRQTTVLSFLVGRPPNEPGFRLDRQDASDRRQRYIVHAYATDQPAGARYPAG